MLSNGPYSSTKSNSNETTEHFLIKCLVWKILLERNHKSGIEVELGNGVVDCLDIKTMYAYEIEPRIDPKKLKAKFDKYSLSGVKEVVMIPYKKIFKEAGIDTKTLRKLRSLIDMYVNA